MKTHVLVSFCHFDLVSSALQASKNETETDQITQNPQKLMLIKHLYTSTEAALHSSSCPLDSFYARVCWCQIGPLVETISAF